MAVRSGGGFWLLAPWALAGLVGCAGAAPLVDAALARALVGAWCNPRDGDAGCWAHDLFREDGSFQACGRTEDDARPFHGQGRYGVQGRRMCYRVTQATPNFWLPAGARYCTDIVAIDARAHRYRDIDTGAEFELRRVPAAAVRCPDGGP
jgi:hypothetical protein